MHALPLSWPLEGRRVVLIGEEPLLSRKVTLLEKTPATLSVYDFSDAGGTWPSLAALEGAALIVVAFTDRVRAEQGAYLAKAARVPVNVVDQPDLTDFHVPAIIDRGALSIGVASGGTAPVLARETRRRIEAAVPPSEAQVATWAERLSPRLRSLFPDVDARRRVWEHLLDSPFAEQARAGDIDGAEVGALAAVRDAQPLKGSVAIVGAGPGDPELLTLKALRHLSSADVLIYDRLVSPAILDLVRRDARRLYVGKARSHHSVPQDQIHALMVEEARKGQRVVRLKGGDPFIFGRGGEELAALKAEGIDTVVVPGITAALGCAAATGVPLTHRDYAQAVTFLTGHARPDAEGRVAPDLDWVGLARPNHTLVVYMGVETAAMTALQLIAAGRAPTTPVLVVENGTRPDQRQILTPLTDLPSALETFAPSGPALLIIGEVAALADQATVLVAKAAELRRVA
ncbi:MAG: siroheme synthase CysG [Asticcacaulis sp.]